MLTMTAAANVSKTLKAAHNETQVSDIEISRRLLRIRSGWTVGERLDRRREAERRFADLMNALLGDAA